MKKYARTVPTNDTATLQYNPQTKAKDVLLYNDAEGMSLYARVPHFFRTKPRRNRTKRYTINCYQWDIVWI